MVENLDVLPKLSSRKLAEKTYTSPTTIVRFVKKLGYQNYNDFKYNIISKLKNSDEESQIKVHEEALSVLNKVEKMQKEAMNDFKSKISIETFQEIINVCDQYQYIDIIANDCNAILGKYALHYLSSLGKIVHVYYETNQQIYASMNVPTDHLVIIISKYALHETLLNCALTLKRRRIKTLAITNHHENTLSKTGDCLEIGLWYFLIRCNSVTSCFFIFVNNVTQSSQSLVKTLSISIMTSGGARK